MEALLRLSFGTHFEGKGLVNLKRQMDGNESMLKGLLPKSGCTPGPGCLLSSQTNPEVSISAEPEVGALLRDNYRSILGSSLLLKTNFSS